ncbi:MAG TPA: recombinase family protein [Rhizomicrobium sp.]|nr:recombinase family protein [Rhizomicrobium sp.]
MKPKSLTDIAIPKTVGIWIRVSTEDQARGESPAVHEKRARLYAEAKGWNVREVYDLAGVSGKAVMAHSEAQRMLADVRGGRITGLIFSKLARLARNTKELLEFSEEFRKYGADLISLAEAIDTTSPAGRLFYTMIAAMAQWEREEIASRVAASIPIRAKLGKPLGGKTPFGYRLEGGKLVPDPKEAPVRKLIYELFIEKKRRLAVARILNERGHRTSTGKKFSRQTVERLIRDMSAKGIHRVNYTHLSDDGVVRPKPEEEWVLRDVPPIVSVELWEEANAILETQRKTRTHIGRRAVHLFAGLTYCACGHKMYVPSRNPRYRCTPCGNSIAVTDLEAIYHGELKGFLFSDVQITAHRLRTDELLARREEEVGHLAGEAHSVQQEMDKVYRLYQSDQITGEGFALRYRPLEERLKALQSELPSAQAALDVLRIHHLSQDAVLADARDLHSRWNSLSYAEKRDVVEAITKRITVEKEGVVIELRYDPDRVPPPHAGSGNSPAPSSGYTAPLKEANNGIQSRRWKRWDSFPAASRMTSTISS